MLFYNARWVDPALGRFIQADSIIPQNQGVQAWDRFAYTNNNPVRYNDPTGHCPLCVIAIGGVIVATPFVLSGLGLRPDVEGALVANAVTMKQDTDILVTTGIALQSEYPWGIVFGDAHGWAQATNDDLDGESPYSSSVAVKVINKRIYGAIDACKLCNDGNNDGVDKLIVAALAQNGFDFSPKGVGDAMSKDNIDWKLFLKNNGNNTSDEFAQMRQNITHMNYGTQFMLKQYIQDLRLLMSMGYDLPDWLKEEDIKYIEDHNYFMDDDDEKP